MSDLQLAAVVRGKVFDTYVATFYVSSAPVVKLVHCLAKSA